MTTFSPFKPAFGTNQSVSPAASSARVALKNLDNRSLFLNNSGSNICYVRLGDSSVVATAADCPVIPGSYLFIERGLDTTSIAYISASGTTLDIMQGEGSY